MKKSDLKNIDKGFYMEAKIKEKDCLTYLTDLVAPELPEIDAVYQRLSRKMTRQYGNIEGTVLEENLYDYAYRLAGIGKAMAVAGIKRGDTVEKAFFSSSNASGTQGLFPAFLASQIIVGQLATSLVPVFCLAEIRIGSHVQEKVTMTDTTTTRQLRHIGEGADLPKTTISRSNGSIALQKYGRLLEATYESIRLAHLDIVSLQLQRMGRQIGIDETDDLIETLIAGDGNSGTANTPISAANAGTLTYDDLIRLYQGFPIGYQMRRAAVNDTLSRRMLNLAEVKDPQAFSDGFTRTGQLPMVMGADWHRWTSSGSASFGASSILAVDDRAAAVCYREGDIVEEADQLIDKQIHQRSMTEWMGFMVLDTNAIQVLAD